MRRVKDSELEYRTQFARRLRKLVYSSGMTVCEISKKLELSGDSVYSYLRGDSLPKAHVVARMCAVFKIDANELLDVRKVDTCKLK